MGAVEIILGIPISIVLIALISAGARIFISTEQMTLKSVAGYLFFSVFAALITYPVLTDLGYTKSLVTLLVATGCLVAKDIILFILKLADQLRQDPLAIVREVINLPVFKKKDGDDK